MAANPADVHFLRQVNAYRRSLVRRIADIERALPETGDEMRPYCEMVLVLDRARWALEDLGAIAR